MLRKYSDEKNIFHAFIALDFTRKPIYGDIKKNCNVNLNETNCRNHLSESQTFLAVTGMPGNYLNKSRIKQEVFSIMRADDISYAAKKDPLICVVGESYMNKHKRKQMSITVSNKMRELGRLKLILVQSASITQLIEILPDSYDLILTAVKILCEYDAELKSFKAPSLALHFGTTLKFVCANAK